MAEEPSEDAIALFSRHAARHLRSLPPERRERALAEAEGHLRARAADLAAASQSSKQAAQAALALFGSARSWASGVVDAYYTDPLTRPAQRAAIVSATIALIGCAILSLTILAFNADLVGTYPQLFIKVPIALFIAGALATTAAAVWARKGSTSGILIISTLIVTASFVIDGSYGMLDSTGYPSSRSFERMKERIIHSEHHSYLQDTARLESGLTAFRSSAFDADIRIPIQWRAPSGFIVPIPITEREKIGYLSTSSFKQPIRRSASESSAAYRSAIEREPYSTVAILTEARRSWAQNGIADLAADHHVLASENRELAAREFSEVNRSFFSLTTGRFALTFFPLAIGLLILSNWLGAWYGRWSFRRRQASHATLA